MKEKTEIRETLIIHGTEWIEYSEYEKLSQRLEELGRERYDASEAMASYYKMWRKKTKENESLKSQLKELKDKAENNHKKWELGVCPKCGVSMFDKFNAEIHDVENCGRRKHIANNYENA